MCFQKISQKFELIPFRKRLTYRKKKKSKNMISKHRCDFVYPKPVYFFHHTLLKTS